MDRTNDTHNGKAIVYLKNVLQFVFIFIGTLCLMVGSLVLVCLIPRDLIQKKSEESAEYLMERDVHYYNLIGEPASRYLLQYGDFSRVDQYADTILLSIAYYLDSSKPLDSVLWARYYDGRDNSDKILDTMNESFARSVTENTPSNMQYIRYWHGSLIFVRPLLTFLNLKQMKIFHEIVIFGISLDTV